MRRFLVIVLLFASPALAESSLATTALVVDEPDEAIVHQEIEKRLTDTDPRIRAIAARVANVRGLTTLLPTLKRTLTEETNREAAREQIRAIALLGARAEIDFLSDQIRRFDGRLDGVLATSIARRGGAEAFEVYDSHVKPLASLGDTANFFTLAFWRAPLLVTPTAARLLGRQDHRGWLELLRAVEASDLLPPIGVAVAALDMDDAFRTPTAWHLARTLACEGEFPGCRSDFTKLERDVLMSELQEEPPSESPPAFRFARELLRRILALETNPRTTPDSLRWLSSKDADRYLSPNHPLLAKYLTRAERTALSKGEKLSELPKPRTRALAPTESTPPEIALPTPLPKGVASSILAETKCHGPWIGFARASLDKYGRVSAVDVSSVETTPECQRALAAMAKLSLPSNRSMKSPHTEIGNLLVVRAEKAELCLDEPDVLPVDHQIAAGIYTVGRHYEGEVKPPKVLRRVDPRFPEGLRRRMNEKGGAALVTVGGTITREGCLRDVGLVKHSPLGDVNREALFAASQWTFEPGTLDGKPVDVLFTLT